MSAAMKKLLNRLRTALADEGHGSQARLAETAGVSRETVNRWLASPPRAIPGGEAVLVILEYLR